jgi:integrase
VVREARPSWADTHAERILRRLELHESGRPTDVIERQLSHCERSSVKAAYNHAEHLSARRQMMQAWADYLDSLRTGAEVVPLRAA